MRFIDVVQIDRLFHEEHVAALRESGQELLWALPHEIPAQVAVDDDGRIRVSRGLSSKRTRQSSMCGMFGCATKRARLRRAMQSGKRRASDNCVRAGVFSSRSALTSPTMQ